MLKKGSRAVIAGFISAAILAMSAGAAVVSPESPSLTSSLAGETVVCDITYLRADGSVQTKSIEVDVPANTARMNVQEMLLQEAEAAMFQSRAARAPEAIYQASGKYFPATNTSDYDGESIVANFTLSKSYTMLGIVFSDISPYPTSINCRLVDVNMGYSKTLYNNESITGSNNRTCKILFQEGTSTDGGGNVPSLTSGKTFNMMASCTSSNPPLGGIADVLVQGYSVIA